MPQDMLHRFADTLRAMSPGALEAEIAAPERLRLDAAEIGGRRLEVAYAPFDHVNPGARIVVVGLTPGRTQMANALREARKRLLAGDDVAAASAAAKTFASFSGPMRSNLVAMLDGIGVARLLGLASTAELWGPAADLVQFTSVLRHPVFVDGGNYSGAPDPVRTQFLFEQVRRGFGEEVRVLRDALFVPLGPKATAAVEAVASEAGLAAERILSGLPHPSGANAERIAFFLGRKPREALSSKVDPDRLLAARRALDAHVHALGDAR